MSSFESEGTKLETETWKILDQLRARLQALVGGLTVMQGEIGNPNGRLPPWTQFQSSMNRVQREMGEVVQYLKEQQEAISSIVVVPDPKFPLQQQHILETLMRTKMEPAVEDWMDQNLKIAKEKEDEDNQVAMDFGDSNTGRLTEEDREKFWLSAVLTANHEGRKHVWGADFTMAEKELGCENIDTGLSRELEIPPTPDPYNNDDLSGEEDEDQFQDEDNGVDESKDTGTGGRMDLDQAKRGVTVGDSDVVDITPQVSIDAIHKFMTKGEWT